MRLLLVAFSLASIPTACLHFSPRKSQRQEQMLTQKAIFDYLETPIGLLTLFESKGRIQIDPMLSRKGPLVFNGKEYFPDEMRSPLLPPNTKVKPLVLNIPDSLAGKYTYTIKNDEDYEHDFAIIHHFSPLLPTAEANIFLMEHHVWACVCVDRSCARELFRHFLKFEVRGDSVKYLPVDVPMARQLDFIGFGGFPRRKFDNAKPGDKLDRFGSD